MRKYIMASWLIYVVLLSLLPLAINFVIYFFADKNVFIEYTILMGELFFFTLMMSADILKNISQNKMNEISKTLHIVILFIALLLIILSSMLFGLNITNSMGITSNLNVDKLSLAAILFSVGSFFVGLFVQIWQITQIGR